MAVKITLIKAPAGQPVTPNHKRFGSRGGVIGRSPESDWQLPDPERFLSGRHCQVQFVDGRCVLKDHSTNGTFVNGAVEPVGRGREVTLADGDTFDVGDYRFRVTLEPAELIIPEKPFNDALGDATAMSAVSAKPAAAAIKPAAAKAAVSDDPLAEFDALLAIKPKAPPAAKPPTTRAVDPLEEALQWPASVNASGDGLSTGGLPDDWADDISLLGQSGAPKARYALPDDDSLIVNRPRSPAPAPAPAPKPTPLQSSPRQVRATAQLRPTAPAPAPLTTARPRPPVANSTAASGEATTLAAALQLKAPLSTDAEARLPEICATMLRETLTGLMQVLRSRASIKNEFRMNVTTIQPVENNPIKFSANADEALELMFVRPSKAYKDPVTAIEESFDSIADHQVAVIAGIRSAFRALLTEFDPAALEEKFERSGKRGLFGLSDAKRWRAYEEHYRGLSENLERSFQELFGDEFVQAYEDQLRKLSALRRRESKPKG